VGGCAERATSARDVEPLPSDQLISRRAIGVEPGVVVTFGDELRPLGIDYAVQNDAADLRAVVGDDVADGVVLLAVKAEPPPAATRPAAARPTSMRLVLMVCSLPWVGPVSGAECAERARCPSPVLVTLG
jgi:hypothetical protein